MGYSHILWDFNGTLLDDVEIGIESVNRLLSARGLPCLKGRADYFRHFRFPVSEYYRSLGFDFEREPYPVLADEWVAEYTSRESRAKACPFAEEALRYIQSELRIPQVIFSACEREMLNRQLCALGFSSYFSEVIGGDTVYAHGKEAAGRLWISRNRPDRALLIGDTLHDVSCAEAMKIECVLVAQGHQSEAQLSSSGAPVLRDLRELPAFLAKNS